MVRRTYRLLSGILVGLHGSMRIPALAALFLLMNASFGREPVSIQGIAWPALSPDGETMVFEWLNDLWLAPSSGGEARRLVNHGAREAYPKFSPDGHRVLFSSERTGSAQLYSVDLNGEDLMRHSKHSEGNILEAVSPDGSYAIARGFRSAPGYKPSRLVKVDLTQSSRELMLFDATAHSVSVSPDGNRFLFCRGGEQLYRSGYRGSRASEIHLYDSKEARFSVLIDEIYEAKTPLWREDGEGFYYVSNRSGCSNLWFKAWGGGGDEQLTFFTEDPVVLPVISGDGRVMVFRAGQKLYRFFPGSAAEPEVIKFFTNEKLPDAPIRKERVTGTQDVVFLEDGKSVVFSAAGDLWVKRLKGDLPTRLTASDQTDERELEISDDENSIYFLSDDGLHTDVCQADFDGEILGETTVLFSSETSKKKLELSPDGSRLSWLQETGDLWVGEIGEKEPVLVMSNWDTPTYDWSPDGRWLVVAAKDIHSNRDIWLVSADGSMEPMNVTRHPAFEASPKWSPDGKTIVFTARREADEVARLWKVDVSSLITLQGIAVEEVIEEIRDSVERIATEVEDVKRVAWAGDSTSLFFQSRDSSDEAVYRLNLEGGTTSQFASFRGIPAGLGTGGESYWRVDRKPVIYDGQNVSSFELSFPVTQQRTDRLRLGFRKIWRTLHERFYDASMNQKDWYAILEKYEPTATSALESRQFDRIVGQLLGELNASHLTFKSTLWGLKPKNYVLKKPTAHPGLEFKASWQGPLVIERVIAGSPISQLADAPVPGEIILRIAGNDVDARTPLTEWFNGAEGRVIPLVVQNAQGKKRTLELIPISYEKARELRQGERLEEFRAAAEDQGFAYLSFPRMKKADLDDFSVELYRASLRSKGLLLDLRGNAGGRVADELLAFFLQPVHSFTLPRGGTFGYPTDRRIVPAWNGPMVVLCNENTYSNAEIFCHAFKQSNRGPLVGQPTNGGVISAVGVKIPEVGELQIPFRGWFHAETGLDLELNGAVPDVTVPLLPEDEVMGRNPQFDAGLRALASEVESVRERPKHRYKHAEDGSYNH